MAIAAQYYICNTCRFRSTLLSRIKDHLLEHSDTKQLSRVPNFDCFDRLKPLKCPSCNFSTESLVLLRYHIVHNHDQQQFSLKAKLKSCKKCGFCTHSNYLWIRHPTFGTCKDKKEIKRMKKKIAVSKLNNRKVRICNKCDYRTLYSRNFKNHVINKHTPSEKINWQHCKKCPAKFKSLTHLKQHQKYVHASAVDHLHCLECDYSTPLRYMLKKHFNNKHGRPEDIKWLECYNCGAKFKSKLTLERHLAIRHTSKEKQYKCDQCSFETQYKHNLKTHTISRHLKHHVMVKHEINGEVFQCKQCPYNSRSKKYLSDHINVMHKQPRFNCEKCFFVTKTKQNLKHHMFNKHTVHNEEDKLNCSHCSYFCFYKRYLKKHLKLKHEIQGSQ